MKHEVFLYKCNSIPLFLAQLINRIYIWVYFFEKLVQQYEETIQALKEQITIIEIIAG